MTRWYASSSAMRNVGNRFPSSQPFGANNYSNLPEFIEMTISSMNEMQSRFGGEFGLKTDGDYMPMDRYIKTLKKVKFNRGGISNLDEVMGLFGEQYQNKIVDNIRYTLSNKIGSKKDFEKYVKRLEKLNESLKLVPGAGGRGSPHLLANTIQKMLQGYRDISSAKSVQDILEAENNIEIHLSKFMEYTGRVLKDYDEITSDIFYPSRGYGGVNGNKDSTFLGSYLMEHFRHLDYEGRYSVDENLMEGGEYHKANLAMHQQDTNPLHYKNMAYILSQAHAGNLMSSFLPLEELANPTTGLNYLISEYSRASDGGTPYFSPTDAILQRYGIGMKNLPNPFEGYTPGNVRNITPADAMQGNIQNLLPPAPPIIDLTQDMQGAYGYHAQDEAFKWRMYHMQGPRRISDYTPARAINPQLLNDIWFGYKGRTELNPFGYKNQPPLIAPSSSQYIPGWTLPPQMGPTPTLPPHSWLQYPSPIGPNPMQGPVNHPSLRAVNKIGEVLPIIAKPIVNIAKALGTIASDAGKAGATAMSLASAILGNPFDSEVLDSLTDMQGTMGNLGGSTLTNIGGVIGGAGEGIGKFANDTWSIAGGKNASASVSKFGAAGMALGAVASIVGSVISAIGQAITGGFNIATSLLKSINKTTLKLLATSPLFETIKNTLNLAYTMAFLPMMTLFENELMPVVLGLLDSSVKFGEVFASMFSKEDIDAMVSDFSSVAEDIASFFGDEETRTNLKDMVKGMIGLLPNMIELQTSLIKLFVDNEQSIMELANKTLDAMKTFVDKGLLDKLLSFADSAVEFISKYGKPLAEVAVDTGEFLTDIGTGTAEVISGDWDWEKNPYGVLGTWLQEHDFGDKLISTLKELKPYGKNKLLGKYASGGYIPATPGGVPCIVGEGGEGEYIIPESKLGGVTIVFSGNVYGMNDFKQQVRTIMNEYNTKANYR